MIEVKVLRTRAELRAFFEIDKGYLREEAKYLGINARPEINPLCANGECAYILCRRDGKSVFRAFTGIDEIYCARTGQRQGYFALFDGEDDRRAACAVLGEIENCQRKWGARSIIGPVSPDGSGLFMGVGSGTEENGRGIFTGAVNEFKMDVLKENGYAECVKEGAYMIDVPDENPFSALSEKARIRFGLEARPLRENRFAKAWKKHLSSVTNEIPPKDFFRFLEKIERFIAFDHSFLLFTNSGCIGYLLCLKSKNSVPRVITLMTKKGIFTPPAALVLTDRVLTSFRNADIKKYEASVIDERNFPSFSILSHVNARKNRIYTQFIKNIQ